MKIFALAILLTHLTSTAAFSMSSSMPDLGAVPTQFPTDNCYPLPGCQKLVKH